VGPRFIAILFVGVAALGFVWPGFGFSSGQQPLENAKAVDVSAIKLFADYDANEARADAAYKGAMLRVTGNVDRIGKESEDAPKVTLMTNSAVRRVLARFPESDRAQVARLYRHQWITVVCRADGRQTDVLLSNCRLKENDQ
jgi:hypothetical protein